MTKESTVMREILFTGSEYGELQVTEEDGRYFWGMEDWGGVDWDEIPKYLFDALNQYQDTVDARNKSRKDPRPARGRIPLPGEEDGGCMAKKFNLAVQAAECDPDLEGEVLEHYLKLASVISTAHPEGFERQAYVLFPDNSGCVLLEDVGSVGFDHLLGFIADLVNDKLPPVAAKRVSRETFVAWAAEVAWAHR